MTIQTDQGALPAVAAKDEDAVWRRLGIERPPTEDELPYSDGMPMDSEHQALQMDLLFEVLRVYWTDRDDIHVGKNQFLYFSTAQARTEDFLGPDVYVVLNVPKRIRKSWVTWDEGKGPDVVMEIMSPRTSARDRGEKKQIYQDKVRAPEYFWYDPDSGELAGFSLVDGVYAPIEADADGRLVSRRLGLALQRWDGTYQDTSATWLRWTTLDGDLLPTGQEQEWQRANAERQRTNVERQRAESAEQELARMEALLATYRQRLGEAPE